jgi:cytochrome-b5 reductase
MHICVYVVIEVEKKSHDVRRMRFALQSPNHIVGLPVGRHIALKFTNEEGKEVQRSYTPVSSDDDLGFVEFMIKVYPPNVNPRFPNGGAMSWHLENMKVGDSMLMKGPKGHLSYAGCGNFSITHRGHTNLYHKKKLGMVAGGTGITPMLQVIRAIMKDPNNFTDIWLIFANQTEQDIFLRNELESLPKHRFHLWYTLDRPPADWKFSTGFINAEMCKAHLPPPSEDTMLFMCGPRPMIENACMPAFKELGFQEDDWFVF